ncbi:MAG: hypothetical protein HY755_13155 [Nitrospirae bacterium]|nr:hypothetical protein [Nitrospirota bacterium]
MWLITIVLLFLIAFSLTYILPYVGYPSDNIVPDLLINLIAGTIIFVVGLNWDKIRSLAGLDFLWLRCLFGRKSVEIGRLNITLDTYRDIRLLPEDSQKKLSGIFVPHNTNRFYKTFPDNHYTAMQGAFERLMGYCSARASSYLIEKLSPYFKRGVGAFSDEEVASKWEDTFINLGSSASNIKTDDIKHHIANNLFKEDINGVIELKNGLSFKPDNRHDVGIILKIKNPHFNNYSLIVCAGIGEWGTSGAAWYLSRHWKKLSKRFLKSDFVVIVSILRGSDESASEKYSTESWINKIISKVKK